VACWLGEARDPDTRQLHLVGTCRPADLFPTDGTSPSAGDGVYLNFSIGWRYGLSAHSALGWTEENGRRPAGLIDRQRGHRREVDDVTYGASFSF